MKWPQLVWGKVQSCLRHEISAWSGEPATRTGGLLSVVPPGPLARFARLQDNDCGHHNEEQVAGTRGSMKIVHQHQIAGRLIET